MSRSDRKCNLPVYQEQKIIKESLLRFVKKTVQVIFNLT